MNGAKLNDYLLGKYIETFYGYGRWDAPYWFIGMEEACYFTVEHINQRLATWNSRGKKALESMEEFAPAIGCNWHGAQATLQPTWGKLIRTILTATNSVISDQSLLEYQKSVLGTHAGNTCLVELFPLPSPGIKYWFYRKNSKIPFLQTRNQYDAHLRAKRIQFLIDRVKEQKPRVVIFYGISYSDAWKQIAQTKFKTNRHVDMATANGTSFYIMRHPSSCDSSYFDSVGNFIKESSVA